MRYHTSILVTGLWLGGILLLLAFFSKDRSRKKMWFALSLIALGLQAGCWKIVSKLDSITGGGGSETMPSYVGPVAIVGAVAALVGFLVYRRQANPKKE